jgi:hypothetical protein
MPTLHMGESVYRFQPEVVERIVEAGQPGNYALGVRDEKGEFYPRLIGWSPTDVRRELMAKLGTVPYEFFKVAVSGVRSAYDLECAQYHSFRGQLDDPVHPVAPPGSGLSCFLCGV